MENFTIQMRNGVVYVDDETNPHYIYPPEVLALRALPYLEYLQTDYWKQTRQEALDLHNHRCDHCASANELQVHHMAYNRIGFECMSDLWVLCRTCHGKQHGRLKEERAAYSITP